MCQSGILLVTLGYEAYGSLFERCKRMDLIVTDIFEENETYFK